MKIVEKASTASTYRGYDYYVHKKVLDWMQESENVYTAKVSGSNGEIYNVKIDTANTMQSSCDCPFAKDKRCICKHMVALYFTAFPKEAEQYRLDLEDAYEEGYADDYDDDEDNFFENIYMVDFFSEEQRDEIYEKLYNYIFSLSKKELQEQLYNLLVGSTDWVISRFMDRYGIMI